MTRYVMVIDQRRCIGCHSCTVACRTWNDLPIDIVYNPVVTEGVKGEHRDAVFLSRQKRRINGRTVELMMKKYLKDAQLNEQRYTPHKLRHTAATLMFSQGGVDVRTLKEILGHEQLNTTQIYTHVGDWQLREATQKNPLAGLKRERPRAPEVEQKKASGERQEQEDCRDFGEPDAQKGV